MAYASRTLVGNWKEDQQSETSMFADLKRKSELGLLDSYAPQPILLSTSKEGVLRFGDTIMLQNVKSKGSLAANPLEKPESMKNQSWTVTTSPDLKPTTRTTFQITRVPGEIDPRDEYGADVVRYGQKMQLVSLEQCKGAPMYLYSQTTSLVSYSKFTRKQEVCLTVVPDYNTIWQIVHPEVKFRLEFEGKPVTVGDVVLINHCRTNVYLASCQTPYPTDFGREWEAHCHTHLSPHRAEKEENQFKKLDYQTH
eukprot:TRINITY_DN2531_c0_g1_i2.p1 TRINITY_DN2531_c0_g1~~TRINITY_DN2531_c0_g1_i2.p1  ORF type:complete len:253 (-),score=44.82 TRINITY_DN2531_c0_g1_i2:74-832(-)